jgi:hypothetical protein
VAITSEVIETYILENSDRIITNVLTKLIENQNLLKLLLYPTKDALYQPDLTQEQINALFDSASSPDMKRILFMPFNIDVADSEKSEIRIFIRSFTPDNIQITNLSMCIQVICSNNVWLMDEGRMTPLVLIQEILKSLNGVDVEFVGNLYFNAPIKLYYYNSHFSGYELYPNVRSV